MRTPLAALVLLLGAGPALTAPPELTFLFPAGAVRGSTVEVFAGGKFGKWPPRTWASDKSITVTPAKESGKLSVTVDAKATPGTHWVRLHDDEGASVARAFIVGTIPEIA